MSPDINIRAAQKEDAGFAASMIYLSMTSLADHLFQQDNIKLIESMMAKLFACDIGRFSYKHAFVAEYEDQPVGLLVASRGRDLNRLNLETAPPLVSVLGLLQAVAFMYRGVTLPGGREAYEDEYYICNLAIVPSMQGRSFGSRLLAYTEGLAHKNDITKCALIAGWHNTKARRLYERIGYQIVETVPDEKTNLGYYRMVKVLYI